MHDGKVWLSMISFVEGKRDVLGAGPKGHVEGGALNESDKGEYDTLFWVTSRQTSAGSWTDEGRNTPIQIVQKRGRDYDYFLSSC